MSKEEKQLLPIDLCARLPYSVYIGDEYGNKWELVGIETDANTVIFKQHSSENLGITPIKEIRPYLRPMSSMTVEEGERLEQIAKETLGDFMFEAEEDGGAIYHMDKWKTLSPAMFDYLNSIHIDYRGLIEMGLALPAPDGMYNKYETSNI